MPTGLLLPLESNTIQTERFTKQIEASKPLKKQLWQTIIQTKIRQQGEILKSITHSDGGLFSLVKEVKSDDSTNVEGQAAQRYWTRLLGKEFRRNRFGDPPNHFLNYGYMIYRSAIARSISASGLLPILGIHHHNRYNAFCLADDLMEPYRPFVDLRVWSMVQDGVIEESLNQALKKRLLSTLYDAVIINGKQTTIYLAMQTTAFSLYQSFLEGEEKLIFPIGIPHEKKEEKQD